MRYILSLAALAAVLVTAPAHAAHDKTEWYTWAYPIARYVRGPVVEAFVWIKSGTVQDSHTMNGGTFEAGPLTPDPTSLWATANATWQGNVANVTSSADLPTGTVKATVTIIERDIFSTQGSSQSIFREGLFFTNTTAAWLPIGYRVEVHGAVNGLLGALGGTANWSAYASIESWSCSDWGQCIAFAADGSSTVLSEFRADYTIPTGLAFLDENGQAAAWTVTTNPGHDVSSGLFDFTMATTLWVPPGETTLVVQPQINLTFCGAATGTCDFAMSARLGPAPEGLSWTSDSGAFLSGLGSTPGPGGVVPEPATWALLIAGFGLVGQAARRRRVAVG